LILWKSPALEFYCELIRRFLSNLRAKIVLTFAGEVNQIFDSLTFCFFHNFHLQGVIIQQTTSRRMEFYLYKQNVSEAIIWQEKMEG